MGCRGGSFFVPNSVPERSDNDRRSQSQSIPPSIGAYRFPRVNDDGAPAVFVAFDADTNRNGRVFFSHVECSHASYFRGL